VRVGEWEVEGGRWKVEGRCGPVAVVGVSASEGLFYEYRTVALTEVLRKVLRPACCVLGTGHWVLGN